jgi:antitoxin component of MazEF toxin-antitoxin module
MVRTIRDEQSACREDRGLRTIDRDFAALQLVHAPTVASLVITSYNYSMKIPVRRVGNSLGIIIPKPVLEAWGVGEGDRLELTARGLRPAARPGLRHEALDELKRSIALAVVRQFTPREIRAQILANLHRWSRQGAWVSAYDEWRDIATRADDGELFAAMLGRDDNALRLRQSMPFVGLLSQAEVRRLHEEAAG